MIDSRRRYPSVGEAFEVWKNYLVSMGYGYKLGIDLPGENRGFLPNSEYYDKYHGKRWSSSTVISIAIGQGEVLATPLQICNLAATIANRGYFITPHVVKEVQDTPLDSLYTDKRYTMVNRENYEIVAEGMRNAVIGGTCEGRLFRILRSAARLVQLRIRMGKITRLLSVLLLIGIRRWPSAYMWRMVVLVRLTVYRSAS